MRPRDLPEAHRAITRAAQDHVQWRWFDDATDPELGVPVGPVVMRGVHPRSACAGRPCVIHDPSDHHMRTWPLLWRADTRVMERTCEHGVGHPDPDDDAYLASIGRALTHGCDGCCVPPE